MLFLGIDTSNYTTSLAVFDDETKQAENFRKMLPVKNGEKGLRQNDAVFLHLKNLPALFHDAAKKYDFKTLAAIGVSDRPRNLPGSYMPCFVPGQTAADVLSDALSIPLKRFSHQEGHIMAGIYSAGNEALLQRPFLAFHFSGGTSDVLLAEPKKEGFLIETIGQSLDITAGQLIDRVGVAHGLSFPAGKEMDAASLLGKSPVRPRICVRECSFHLSGFENIAEKMRKENVPAKDIFAFIFETVALVVRRAAENARETYGPLPVLLAGGVMASESIRRSFAGDEQIYFAGKEYCTDNAAGIACLCPRFGGR
jgi:N6-L-threonylcarbamoyladenine synthase